MTHKYYVKLSSAAYSRLRRLILSSVVSVPLTLLTERRKSLTRLVSILELISLFCVHNDVRLTGFGDRRTDKLKFLELLGGILTIQDLLESLDELHILTVEVRVGGDVEGHRELSLLGDLGRLSLRHITEGSTTGVGIGCDIEDSVRHKNKKTV